METVAAVWLIVYFFWMLLSLVTSIGKPVQITTKSVSVYTIIAAFNVLLIAVFML